jgi:hypothetical protein
MDLQWSFENENSVVYGTFAAAGFLTFAVTQSLLLAALAGGFYSILAYVGLFIYYNFFSDS